MATQALHHPMGRLLTSALRSLLILACLGAPASQLAAETLYQVEVIVFGRDSGDSEDSLRSSSELQYPVRTVPLGADGGSGPFQALPASSLQLKREADALTQRRMRVLTHQAWIWPGVAPGQATPVAISGGRQSGAHRELEGYITLSAGHFLQIDTQLWLSRFGGDGSDTLPLPPVPGTVPAADEASSAASRIFLLREQRRMRSGELHYFDHSRLGLLVQVTPVNATPVAANPASAAPVATTPPTNP